MFDVEEIASAFADRFEKYYEGFSDGKQITIKYMKNVLETFPNPTTAVDVLKAFVKSEYKPDNEQT